MKLVSKFVQFTCLLVASADQDTLSTNEFFKTLVFPVFCPVIVIAWFTLLFLLYSCVKGSFSSIRDQYYCMIIITLWLFQPDC